MGFNYEQYDDNYSNAIGFGCGFIFNKKKKAECERAKLIRKQKTSTFSLKSFFGIGDGKIFGKVVNPRKKLYSESLKKAEQRQANTNYQNSFSNVDGESNVTNKKNNTILYVGIGVFAIGLIAYSLKNKNK